MILFNENLVLDLKSRGFIIDIYALCLANMMVNGKQMTITWNVNNLKILHIDTDEATKVIYRTKGICGSHTKELRGKKHD